MCFQLTIAPVAFAAEEAKSSGDQFRDGSGGGGGGWMDQILGIAIGAQGATIALGCANAFSQKSLMIFMAGGIAYLAKEIFGAKGQAELHKRSAESLKMSAEKMKGGDVQKAALETALEDEKKNLEIIKSKKAWMNAITVIFLAATAAGIIEAMIASTTPHGQVLTNAICKPSLESVPAAMGVAAAYSALANSSQGMGGMLMSGAGSALLVKVVTTTTTTNAATTPVKLGFAHPRPITFGVYTALSKLIASQLGRKEKIFEENVKKLENAIANFKAETTGGTTSGESGGSAGGSDGGTTGGGPGGLNPFGSGSRAITPLPSGVKLFARQCMSRAGEYSGKSCSSPARIPSSKFNGNFDVPTLQAATNLATDMGNAVASGDLEKANVNAANLGSMAAKLEDVKKNLQKQYNDQLKKQGKAPRDFDTEERAQLAQMRSSLGSNPDFAKLAGLEPSGAPSLDATADSQNGQGFEKIASTPSIAVPSGDQIYEDAVPAETPVETAAVAGADMKQDYEYNENDVSDKKEESIFKQVSNRYIFNYPKLFSKNEPKPQEATK